MNFVAAITVPPASRDEHGRGVVPPRVPADPFLFAVCDLLSLEEKQKIISIALKHARGCIQRRDADAFRLALGLARVAAEDLRALTLELDKRLTAPDDIDNCSIVYGA